MTEKSESLEDFASSGSQSEMWVEVTFTTQLPEIIDMINRRIEKDIINTPTPILDMKKYREDRFHFYCKGIIVNNPERGLW